MEGAEKGAASADVCVTKISPCRCGKGIFGNRPINQRWRTKKRGRNPTSKKYQSVKMEVPVYRNETA